MKKDLIAAAFLVVTLACILSIGCRNRPVAEPGTARSITAVSVAHTVEHLRVLPWCGALLIVAGVISGVCNRYAPAFLLGVGGVGMVALYVAASEYPWSVAWFPLVMCLAFCAAMVVWVVERRKRVETAEKLEETTGVLKEAVRVIQPHGDLKRMMGNGDPDRQNEIRKVLDPLKTEMRDEGTIH